MASKTSGRRGAVAFASLEVRRMDLIYRVGWCLLCRRVDMRAGRVGWKTRERVRQRQVQRKKLAGLSLYVPPFAKARRMGHPFGCGGVREVRQRRVQRPRPVFMCRPGFVVW